MEDFGVFYLVIISFLTWFLPIGWTDFKRKFQGMLVVILLKNSRTNLLYLTWIWEINDFQVSIHADVFFSNYERLTLNFFSVMIEKILKMSSITSNVSRIKALKWGKGRKLRNENKYRYCGHALFLDSQLFLFYDGVWSRRYKIELFLWYI